MAELPKFIALQSVKNNKYLVYNDQATTRLPDFLQCSGEGSRSQYARFKVEKDANHPDLVHIKSIYNDKYLCTASQDSQWIVAGADNREPNKTRWSCTLFKPEVFEPPHPYINGKYLFRHVQLGNLVELKSGDDFADGIAAEKANPINIQDHLFILEKLPG